MAVSNTLQEKPKSKPKFSQIIQSSTYKELINTTLKDPLKVSRFVTAITSAVAVNPALQECEASTVLSAALLGEGLNLSPSPQLGQYYLVPYKKKDKQGNVSTSAQFQIGYKGYVQLAIRSGYYKKLNVVPIKAGELIHYDALEETIELNLIEDEEEREKAETIGYYAMFEYLNGFRKASYWTKSKMEKHADRYSQAFSMNNYKKLLAGEIPQKDMWKYSSFWYKNFDDMACKTMLRQLISKWGIMSIDLQEAFEKDMTIANESGTFEHVDSEIVIPKETAEQQETDLGNEQTEKQADQEGSPVPEYKDAIEGFFQQ